MTQASSNHPAKEMLSVGMGGAEEGCKRPAPAGCSQVLDTRVQLGQVPPEGLLRRGGSLHSRPPPPRASREAWDSVSQASAVAQAVKNLPGMRETRARSQGQEDLLEKERPPTPVYSCPENPMDQGAWRAAAHGTAKSRARLSD